MGIILYIEIKIKEFVMKWFRIRLVIDGSEWQMHIPAENFIMARLQAYRLYLAEFHPIQEETITEI